MKLTLKQWRSVKNMTQEQLSDLTGISMVTISKWENGRGSPTVKNLREVSTALGISMDDILLPTE